MRSCFGTQTRTLHTGPLTISEAHHRPGLRTPSHDLALDAGFAHQSHLTRTFKSFLGEPPGRYRERLDRSP